VYSHRIVLAEASSISESKPNPSSATDPASNAATIPTTASTIIQAMLSSESVLTRRTNSERVLPAGSRTTSEEICELTPTRYRASGHPLPLSEQLVEEGAGRPLGFEAELVVEQAA
jgi:hypothetical protein